MRVNAFLDRSGRFDGILVGDTDYTRRREMHLEWLQTRVDSLWNMRPWTWRLKPVTLTIPANQTYLELPSDFIEFGAIGSVQDTTAMKRLAEVSPIEIQTLQRQTARSTHEKFSVWHKANTASPSAMTPHIHIGANSVAQSWVGTYVSSAPTMVDDANVANLTGLERIPTQYQMDVLLNQVKADIMRANGDGRSEQWEGMGQKNLDRLIAVEGTGRHSTPQALPRNLPAGMW